MPIPRTVTSLTLDASSLSMLPLPAVQQDLAVTIPDWDVEMGRALHLSSHLTRLSLTSDHGPADALWDLFPRLPTTLRVLELTSWRLSKMGVLTHLAQHMPPHLHRLQIRDCRLLSTDFDDLVHHWPQTLTHLDLQSNELEWVPVPLPRKLRILSVSQNPLDGVFTSAWIPELPPTLRSMNVEETRGAICAMALLLLQELPSRSPRERITLALDVETLEDRKELLHDLMAAFFVPY
ncbi:hypothetical protein GGF32_007434 [Allomyces javanicus]|nr:hypothetical protein GGF32_007434 [Allomyces javanicus]